jgi:tRNA pseudouridine55 synthase
MEFSPASSGERRARFTSCIAAARDTMGRGAKSRAIGIEVNRTSRINGVISIDKPSGMTSHDVVDRIRRAAGTRRVGHAGTLDPMAEGLLVVCIGAGTRLAQFLTGLPKVYAGTIRFAAISSTYDAEGKITPQPAPAPAIARDVEAAMREQVGLRTQLAPPFSAVKVDGRKLYEYARRGEPVPQKPRRVRIESFDLLDYAPPDVRFLARVGSGTYVRSMAHDLGLRLECGAYLASLRRLAVGDFSVERAARLDAIEKFPELIEERLMGATEALAHLPRITVGPEVERAILHGRGFTTREIEWCEPLPQAGIDSLVLSSRGEAISVARGEPEINGGVAVTVEEEAGIRPLVFKSVRVLAKADAG